MLLFPHSQVKIQVSAWRSMRLKWSLVCLAWRSVMLKLIFVTAFSSWCFTSNSFWISCWGWVTGVLPLHCDTEACPIQPASCFLGESCFTFSKTGDMTGNTYFWNLLQPSYFWKLYSQIHPLHERRINTWINKHSSFQCLFYLFSRINSLFLLMFSFPQLTEREMGNCFYGNRLNLLTEFELSWIASITSVTDWFSGTKKYSHKWWT